jgi:hypothetical protein
MRAVIVAVSRLRGRWMERRLRAQLVVLALEAA